MKRRTELLQSAAAGNQAAWHDLIRRYESMLTDHALMLIATFIRGGVSNEWKAQLADEIVMSAFGTASQALTADRIPYWTQFLKSVAEGKARTTVRKEIHEFTEFLREREETRRGKVADSAGEGDLDGREGEGKAGDLKPEMITAVREALDALPQEDRAMARAHWEEGLAEADVARRFKMGRTQVRWRLARAKALVYTKLQPFLPQLQPEAQEALKRRMDELRKRYAK